MKAIWLSWLNAIPNKKGCVGTLYEPTHEMVVELLIPELEDALTRMGIKYEVKLSPPIRFTLDFAHGRAQIYLKSFQNWQRIVGSNMAWAGVDEMDTINTDIAKKSFEKLMARVRVGKVNQIFVTTTPEGFKYTYKFFEKDAVNEDGTTRTDRRIIRACTLDNPFVKDGYIQSLYQNYTPQQIQAYIHGQFVNFSSGTVYYCFDRILNNSFETIRSNEPLHIGCDFNIGKVAAVIHVLRLRYPVAVDEMIDCYDTPALIRLIQDRYPRHTINIYPDASGAQRNTNAGQTDLQLLKQAGFNVIVNGTNPAVRDRVNAMNAGFLNAAGERRYRVNVARCPSYVEGLEQQGYDKNGAPAKSGDDRISHKLDAAGYAICKLMPIAVKGSAPVVAGKISQPAFR